MRTIIELPTEQIQQLAELCEREHLSRAEVIRQAIAQFLRSRTARPDDAFGIWKDRQIDGVTYQRTLRDEWSE